jgi:hypothetical protein
MAAQNQKKKSIDKLKKTIFSIVTRFYFQNNQTAKIRTVFLSIFKSVVIACSTTYEQWRAGGIKIPGGINEFVR